MLNAIKAMLTPAQLSARAVYFAQAEAWILARPPYGVCAGPTQPFGPDPNIKEHVKNGTRVDVKVYKGSAFNE